MILGLVKIESKTNAKQNDAMIAEAMYIVNNPDEFLVDETVEEVVFA